MVTHCVMDASLAVASCSLALALLSAGVSWVLYQTSRPARLEVRVAGAEETAANAERISLQTQGVVAAQLEALETLADQVERKRRSTTAAAARMAGTQQVQEETDPRQALRRRAAGLELA